MAKRSWCLKWGFTLALTGLWCLQGVGSTQCRSQFEVATSAIIPRSALVRQEFTPDSSPIEVQIAGVRVQIAKKIRVGTDTQNPDQVLNSINYSATIGRISREQFLALKKYFKSPDALTFAPTKSYELQEFLTSFVQTTLGHVFSAPKIDEPLVQRFLSRLNRGSFDTSNAKEPISVITNCWQSALEFLRQNPRGFSAYYPSELEAVKLFSNQSYFQRITERELVYKDVLFITAVNGRTDQVVARHAAIYIGGGLFFEKTGHSADSLYRFITIEEIQREYGRAYFQYNLLRHTSKKLPEPIEFSVAKVEPELAAKIGAVAAERVSVETSFGQGLVAYGFSGMGFLPYTP